MSFRQNNKKSDVAWRRDVRQQLLAAGLPDSVVDDEQHWNYMLLHGYDFYSGWTPVGITKIQAAELLRLLESHYERRVGLELFDILKKRIDEKSPA